MEDWLDPKALLDAITKLEEALRKGDPNCIVRAAETVVAMRDQLFDTARSFVATMLPKENGRPAGTMPAHITTDGPRNAAAVPGPGRSPRAGWRACGGRSLASWQKKTDRALV